MFELTPNNYQFEFNILSAASHNERRPICIDILPKTNTLNINAYYNMLCLPGIGAHNANQFLPRLSFADQTRRASSHTHAIQP